MANVSQKLERCLPVPKSIGLLAKIHVEVTDTVMIQQ
jgi:hypothetical protein